MSKTVFTQYDTSESWYTEHKDVWLDDIKTFYHRPMRCVIIVHPYFLAQRDTDLLAESAYLSCAKACIGDSRFSPDFCKDQRVTLNKRQEDEISNSAALIAETLWSLLTNTVPHGQTMMYMVTPANEASMMAVGHFSKIIDLVKNGLHLTGDSVMRLKNEFASNDPNIIFSSDPFQDDDMERLVEMCLLETYLLHNVSMSRSHHVSTSPTGISIHVTYFLVIALCATKCICVFGWRSFHDERRGG